MDLIKNLKYIGVVTIFIMMFSSCSKQKTEPTGKITATSATKIEVTYFHGKQRCLTCRYIERFAKETVDSCFAGNEAVNFKTVDITTSEGEQVADAYKIAGSALLLIKTENGKISYEDLTKFAFKNARKDTSSYKKGLESKIREYLN